MYYQDTRRVKAEAVPCNVTFYKNVYNNLQVPYDNAGMVEIVQDAALTAMNKTENARLIKTEGYYWIFTQAKKTEDTDPTPVIIVGEFLNIVNAATTLLPKFIWAEHFHSGDFAMWKVRNPDAHAVFDEVKTLYFQKLDQVAKLPKEVRFVMPLYLRYAQWLAITVLVLRILTLEFTVTMTYTFEPTWYNFVYPFIVMAPTMLLKLAAYALGYTNTLHINETCCYLGLVFSRLAWLIVKFYLIENLFPIDLQNVLVELDFINFYEKNIVYFDWVHQIALFLV
jgi:hypothetical protein